MNIVTHSITLVIAYYEFIQLMEVMTENKAKIQIIKFSLDTSATI